MSKFSGKRKDVRDKILSRIQNFSFWPKKKIVPISWFLFVLLFVCWDSRDEIRCVCVFRFCGADPQLWQIAQHSNCENLLNNQCQIVSFFLSHLFAHKKFQSYFLWTHPCQNWKTKLYYNELYETIEHVYVMYVLFNLNLHFNWIYLLFWAVMFFSGIKYVEMRLVPGFSMFFAFKHTQTHQKSNAICMD